MSGKQEDAKLDMPLSEVIKKAPKGDKSKKRKSAEETPVQGQAAKSTSKPSRNKAKKNAGAGTKTPKKSGGDGGGVRPSTATSPSKLKRTRSGSNNNKKKKTASQGSFQITVLKDSGSTTPTAAGRVRAAKAAAQQKNAPLQSKKGKRPNAGLQVTSTIKKKGVQPTARKAKAQGSKGKRSNSGGTPAGGPVTLNQRFSALKNGRT